MMAHKPSRTPPTVTTQPRHPRSDRLRSVHLPLMLSVLCHRLKTGTNLNTKRLRVTTSKLLAWEAQLFGTAGTKMSQCAKEYTSCPTSATSCLRSRTLNPSKLMSESRSCCSVNYDG